MRHTQDMSEPDYIATTRNVYDLSASHYVEWIGNTVSSRFEGPLDRAALELFVETALALGASPVLDIGCGPGRATAFLADRGLDISGVDISPRMIAEARTAHPTIHFDEGSLTDLPVADASLGGAVCWYSIIHTPLQELTSAWRELARALRPEAPLLLGFQAGQNDRVDRQDAYGTGTTLTLYRHSLEDIVSSLTEAGFAVRTKVWREAMLAHETTPQAIVLAQLH